MSPSHLPVKMKIRWYFKTFIYLLKIEIFDHVIKFLILSFVLHCDDIRFIVYHMRYNRASKSNFFQVYSTARHVVPEAPP